jgi:hypothetical protein
MLNAFEICKRERERERERERCCWIRSLSLAILSIYHISISPYRFMSSSNVSTKRNGPYQLFYMVPYTYS